MHSLVASPDTPGITYADFDFRNNCAADQHAYHVAGRMKAEWVGMRLTKITQYPRAMDLKSCEERGPPRDWDGGQLSIEDWRQWRRGSGAAGVVSISRPCDHNDWDKVRDKRGWVVLRCRECDVQWRLRPEKVAAGRCDAFATDDGCRVHGLCPLLHVHRRKRASEERRRGDAASHSSPTDSPRDERA